MPISASSRSLRCESSCTATPYGNLWAVTYAARKNLVFDAGFEKGLTGTSTHWEAFAGLTYLLPHRLWKK